MNSDFQTDHSAHRATPENFPLCYLAIDMRTPTNVGSLFRIADALGVEKIYLTGESITPPNSKMRKTSRATEKQVNYAYCQDPLAVAQKLRSDGYRLACLEITSDSIPLKQLSAGPGERICLILGSEKDGIPQDLLALADSTVHIPMHGNNSSMNVTVACAIATYEITNRMTSA
ncbi:TrmH family RNA methyltransferase [Microbulbifer hainanensis]|uniref:TrmH family RNA methyltransferase n=1 Tax=Microbulbifer hainanensis TaxID=2735675 RepID=UPI00186820CF|nr:TrmH family RNA methyltransferase [Microbulbifer hainanensis]